MPNMRRMFYMVKCQSTRLKWKAAAFGKPRGERVIQRLATSQR